MSRTLAGSLLAAALSLLGAGSAWAQAVPAESPTREIGNVVQTDETHDDRIPPRIVGRRGDAQPAAQGGDVEESDLPADWKPFWTYAPDLPSDRDTTEPDLAQLKLLAEQIPDDRQTAFGAFMGQHSRAQTNDLLRVTRHLRGFGLRGTFAQFLMDLPEKRQTAMFKLIGLFKERQAAAFADELTGNKREDWIAVPYLLDSAGEYATLPLLFGNLPCMRHDGAQPLAGCTLPADTAAFLRRWGVVYVNTAYPIYAGIGIPAPPGLAPWQAQLFRSGPDARAYSNDEKSAELVAYGRPLENYERWHLCGGALIEPGWILTAAHCVVPPNTRGNIQEFMKNRSIRLGTRSIAAQGGTEWAIEGAVRHGRFDLAHMDQGFDIALLRIVRPRRERAGNPAMVVQPAPIKPTEPGRDRVSFRSDVFVTGWGFTNVADRTAVTRANNGKAQVPSAVLQVSHLQLLDVSQCNNDPQFVRSKYRIAPEQGQLCAGSQGIQSSCRGDSGGPLIAQPSGDPVLVGLVSLGIGCGRRAAPSAFVDVAFFRDWIKQAKAHYKPGQVSFWP